MAAKGGRAKGRIEEDGEKEREMKGDVEERVQRRERHQLTVNTTDVDNVVSKKRWLRNGNSICQMSLVKASGLARAYPH